MSVTRVQQFTGAGEDDHTLVLRHPPTRGNLLVCYSKKGSVEVRSIGWSQDRSGVWFRVADGSECIVFATGPDDTRVEEYAGVSPVMAAQG